MATASTDLDTLAGALAGVVGRLRRSLNRRVRTSTGTSPPLPEAQLEILRLVDRHPGLRVHDAAAELRLAPNTVSTLVQRLSADGMIDRQADPDDGRVTRLLLTPPAEERLRLWRDRRREILAARLSQLDSEGRLAVASALPVLERIAISLEEGAPSGPLARRLPAAAGASSETNRG